LQKYGRVTLRRILYPVTDLVTGFIMKVLSTFKKLLIYFQENAANMLGKGEGKN